MGLIFVRQHFHSLYTMQVCGLVNRRGCGCTPCRAGRTRQSVLAAIKRWGIFSTGWFHSYWNSPSLVDPAKVIQLTSNLIPILTSTGITPSCHPLLALMRLHQSLLISSFQSDITQDNLDETIRTMAKSESGLSRILREGHPIRGVALAELGKILAVDEPAPRNDTHAVASPAPFPPSGPPRLKLAYQTLVRARSELLIGFGKASDGGQVGQEIRQMIVSLEKEIGIWSQGVRNVIQDTPPMPPRS